MKSSKVILMVVFSFFIATASQAQKKYLSGNEIPKEIISYVKKHFPDSQIKKVKEEKKPLKTEYEVKLLPKAELEFDGDFKIKEIESKKGIPLSTLPRKVRKYLDKNHPTIKVKEWELKTGGQKIKLLNGHKLYFDTKDNFVSEKPKF